MSYTSGAHKELRSQVHLKGGGEALTLSGTLTLDKFSAQLLALDCNGAGRTVVLPTTSTHEGLFFTIYNSSSGSYSLTVTDAAGSTIVTISKGQTQSVYCTGDAWILIGGWPALATDFGSGGLTTDTIAESTLGNGIEVIDPVLFDATVKFASAAQTIADPGNGGAIPVATNGVCAITTAGAETRTLAIPTFMGQDLALVIDTDGGSAVITVASAINQTGNNTITMADVKDFILLKAVTIGGALAWRVVANDGAALSTV